LSVVAGLCRLASQCFGKLFAFLFGFDRKKRGRKLVGVDNIFRVRIF